MPVSSVGTPEEIVSRSASSSEEIAAKAIAPFTNWDALSSATGATMRAASASSGKNRTSRVVGSESASDTGRRFANSGLRDSIAWFRLAPRAAKALPNPSRTCRLYSRVGVSNVFPMSSNSTCSSPCASARVPPSSRGSPSPRVISRYLRPNDER